MAGKPEKGFKIEYSKSNRAGCKGCGQKIEKDSLRLGRMMPSPHFDGFVPLWHHVPCYFKKKKAVEWFGGAGVADIEGFMDIKFDDQKLIKDFLSGSATIEPTAVKSKAKAKGSGASAAPSGGAPSEGEYVVEVAKSNRSKCRECGNTIEKDQLRCGPMERMDRPPFLPTPQWHHVKCVDVALSGVKDVKDISGFEHLSADDQKILKTKFSEKPKKPTKVQDDSDDDVSLLDLPLVKKESSTNKGKEVKHEAKAAPAAATKQEVAAENAMRTHSDKLYKIRNNLKSVSNSTLKHVLAHNDVNDSGGEVTLQARLADIMLHGVPGTCPQCKKGRLSYEDGKFKCGHHVDEFSRCQYKSSEGPRETFKMPKGIGDEYLANFKFVQTAIPNAMLKEVAAADVIMKEKQQKRNATAELVEAAHAAKKSREKEAETASDPATCLRGLVFALHATKQNPLDKDALSAKITSAGGKLVASMTKGVTHVLATAAAAASGGAPMKEAHNRGLPVVMVGFVDACIADGKRISEKDFLLAGEARVEEAAGSRKRKGEESKTIKVMVKGKGAVDVDSGLADNAHVLEVGTAVYSATLNLTDLASDTNSFYVLQVIQSDTGNKTYLFRKWGRIGTKQGGDKVAQMSKQEAVEEFEALFLEKTGNPWHDRTPDRFKKRPGQFSVMELGIASDSAQHTEKALKRNHSSKLPATVGSFMSLITDLNMMKSTMMEMEIDLDKMPLGALSRAQIEKGYTVLSDLLLVLQDAEMSEAAKNQKILSASNQFYTIVPQNFGAHGMSERHLIDSEKKLLEKRELVETLLEMEIAVSLSKGNGSSSDNPLDESYKKLNTQILPVEKQTKEFELVDKYLQNTHAKTHSTYTLTLVDLFTVSRAGEDERFKKHENNPNRQLLWHGSRLTNWVGILSQGLRIAPPEAPVTGYMFGKGVYFADMSSKSANYCFANPTSNEGVMMLSEVALGEMHELLHANEKLPKGVPASKMSVKGCGKTFPDPAGAETLDDGVVVPCGKSFDNSMNTKSSLLYNEFIVYDTSQIRTRYLLRVKFNFKK